MYLGVHAQWQCHKCFHSLQWGPKGTNLQMCFLIWVSTSRHQGLFFTNTSDSPIPNNFCCSVFLNYRIATLLFSYLFIYLFKEFRGNGVWFCRRVWMKKISAVTPALYISNMYLFPTGTGQQKIGPDDPITCPQVSVEGNPQNCQLFSSEGYHARSNSCCSDTTYQWISRRCTYIRSALYIGQELFILPTYTRVHIQSHPSS